MEVEHTIYKEKRPWGEFENLLDTAYCKVKRIIIKPGGAPSYQYHHKRSEIWTIVKGIGEVTLNDIKYTVGTGEVVRVPVGMKHQIENNTKEDIIFIEVQYGEYFGEDDIIRIKDKYGRK